MQTDDNYKGALATACMSRGSSATRTRLTLTALRFAATAETLASSNVTMEINRTAMDATLSAIWRTVGIAREALHSSQISARRYAEMDSTSKRTPLSATIQTLRVATGKTMCDKSVGARQLARLSMGGVALEAAHLQQTLALRHAAMVSHSHRSPRQPTVMTETFRMETAAVQLAR